MWRGAGCGRHKATPFCGTNEASKNNLHIKPQNGIRFAYTELLQTETKFKTKGWPGIGSARAAENCRFRARSTSAGCPGAGSLAAAAGASKKSGDIFRSSASRAPCDA
jgi:hypothetical protein